VAGGAVGCGAGVVAAEVAAGATVVVGCGVVVTIAVVVGAAEGGGVGTAIVIGASVVPVARSSSPLHALMVSAAQAARQNPRVRGVIMLV